MSVPTVLEQRTAELQKLYGEREQIEHHKIYDARSLLASSAYVFEKNHDELDSFIRRCESYMPMIHAPAYRNQAFLIELTRFLHNYSAAAYSLQQHIDVFQKMISDSVFQEELKQMFANAGSAGYGRFLQGLRNYVQHYAPAPVVSELRYKVLADRPPLDPVQELLLDKKRLLEWGEWRNEAREFIQQHEGHIPLRDTATQHRDLVLDLYSWIFRRVGALYPKPFGLLEEFDKKIWTLYGWSG